MRKTPATETQKKFMPDVVLVIRVVLGLVRVSLGILFLLLQFIVEQRWITTNVLLLLVPASIIDLWIRRRPFRTRRMHGKERS